MKLRDFHHNYSTESACVVGGWVVLYVESNFTKFHIKSLVSPLPSRSSLNLTVSVKMVNGYTCNQISCWNSSDL